MVNLLRFAEQSIRDKWFVINKPFGLPTMDNIKISWDLTYRDSVVNRLLIMGYEDISLDTASFLSKQVKPLHSKCDYSDKKFQESTIKVSLKPSQWRRIASDQPLLSFAPLWSMKTDCRGLLAVAQGHASVQFFKRCVQLKLVRRTYVTLVEHVLESQASKPVELSGKIEGYTIRSDLFWSSDKAKPGREERIYSLFLDNSHRSPITHPWIPSPKLLTVLPCEKINRRKGKYFNLQPKLLKQKLLKNADGSTNVRQMYAVDILEGGEDALRCAFSHYGHPIINDAYYNHLFAENFLKDHRGEPPRDVSQESSEELQNDIERVMLEKALQPCASNFLHLGMCCSKVAFPDPDDEDNQQIMHRAVAQGEEISHSTSSSFGDNLKFITLELPIPPEFTAWLNGNPIPGIAAKSGIRPLSDARSLGKRLIDKTFIRSNSTYDEDEEELIMVRGVGNSSSLSTSHAGKKTMMKYPLVVCTETVEIAKHEAPSRRGLSLDKNTMLCRHCGDFHSESRCALVSVKPSSTIDRYKAFYTHVSKNIRKPSFCITCGVFGHQFYGCVHSFSKFRHGPRKNSKVGESGAKQEIFSRRYRQCQLCQSLDHREISCPQRKSPPWGYDELGSPVRKDTTRRTIKPRRHYT